MITQRFKRWKVAIVGRQQNLFPFKLFDVVGRGKRFREILVHDDPKIVVDGDESAVQGPVQIGAEGEAVGDGIVETLGKRDDVAGIHHGDVVAGINPQAGDAAGVVVNFGYLLLENPTPYKNLFLETFIVEFIADLREPLLVSLFGFL